MKLLAIDPGGRAPPGARAIDMSDVATSRRLPDGRSPDLNGPLGARLDKGGKAGRSDHTVPRLALGLSKLVSSK